MNTTRTGRCLCEMVKFVAKSEPIRTFVCHCTFCQKVTGSAFYVESLFRKEDVELNEDALSKYQHVSDNSNKKVMVNFCSKCGTTIGLTFERWPDLLAISRGCFDDPNSVEITSHIWTRSAQTGVVLPANIDCFTEARSSLDGYPALANRFNEPYGF